MVLWAVKLWTNKLSQHPQMQEPHWQHWKVVKHEIRGTCCRRHALLSRLLFNSCCSSQACKLQFQYNFRHAFWHFNPYPFLAVPNRMLHSAFLAWMVAYICLKLWCSRTPLWSVTLSWWWGLKLRWFLKSVSVKPTKSDQPYMNSHYTGWSKKRIPSFIFGIISVIQHRF